MGGKSGHIPESRFGIWWPKEILHFFYEKDEDLLLELQEWVIALRLLDLQIAIKIIFILFEKRDPGFVKPVNLM